jgi:hypothetical protein
MPSEGRYRRDYRGAIEGLLMTNHELDRNAFGCLGGVIGALLLLPGLCSVIFAGMSVFGWFISNPNAWAWPPIDPLGRTLLIIWAIGLILGALGIWLLIRTRRR